jgi:hypothetical protein
MEKLLLSVYAGLSFDISKIINFDFSIEKKHFYLLGYFNTTLYKFT